MTAQRGARAADRAVRASKSVKTPTEPPIAVRAPFSGPQCLILNGFPDQTQQSLLGPNNGSRRWGVAEERASVQADTAMAVRRQGIRPVAPPVRVTYRFIVPDRARRDWDNYALICKPVQDGLVKAGVLVGDHYAVLTGAVEFQVEKGHRRLLVIIEPLAAAGEGAGSGDQ